MSGSAAPRPPAIETRLGLLRAVSADPCVVCPHRARVNANSTLGQWRGTFIQNVYSNRWAISKERQKRHRKTEIIAEGSPIQTSRNHYIYLFITGTAETRVARLLHNIQVEVTH